MPSMQEIEDLVAEVARNTARAQERAEAWSNTEVRQPIAHDLGEVVVSGYGLLLAIDLNPDMLRYTTERALAPAIVDAIRRAEQKAEDIRVPRETVNKLVHPSALPGAEGGPASIAGCTWSFRPQDAPDGNERVPFRRELTVTVHHYEAKNGRPGTYWALATFRLLRDDPGMGRNEPVDGVGKEAYRWFGKFGYPKPVSSSSGRTSLSPSVMAEMTSVRGSRWKSSAQ